MRNRDDEYIENMVDYCIKIEGIPENVDYDMFITEESYQLSCGMCIIQIGENVSRLSDEFKERYNYIPWRSIKDMGNIVTHKYESAEFDVLRYALTVEIPELKDNLLTL